MIDNKIEVILYSNNCTKSTLADMTFYRHKYLRTYQNTTQTDQGSFIYFGHFVT